MAYQNFFATKLFTDIGAGDTTITLETAPTATSGRLVLEARNSTQREIIKYTGVSGNQITGVLRGQGGTSARSHIKNSLVEMNLTSQDVQDLYDAFASFSSTNNDWRTIPVAPLVVANNGNRSVDMSIVGDYTAVISKGMRFKISRTGTAVQTQVTSLNGTNQYWNDTTVAGMSFTDDFVAGAWIKLSSYPTATASIMSRYNGTNGWVLRLETNGQLMLIGTNGSSTNFKLVQSMQSVPLNKWVHIALQLDMSAISVNGTGLSTTTNYVMIDGVDVPTFSYTSGTSPTALVQAGDLMVGYAGSGYANFPGKIAQAFVSSAKITQANIRSFMNAPLTAALCTTYNIISAYAFDGNGNDINTTNANNLTAQNSAVATNADSPFNANAFGIIMTDPTYSGGLTLYNVQTPEGYPIPNGTLGTSSYSGLKVPYGFPSQSEKWKITSQYNSSVTISFGATGQWSGSPASIALPSGSGWKLGYKGNVALTSSVAGQRSAWFALAPSGTLINGAHYNYPTINRLYAAGGTFYSAFIAADIDGTANTTYSMYSELQTATGSESFAIAGDNTPFTIYAENTLL